MTTYKQKNDMGDTAVDKAQEAAEKTQEKVSETAAAAKEQAKRTAAQVGEQAKQTVDSRMSDVAHEIGSVADAVRQTSQDIGVESQTLSKYGDRLAEQLEGISSYLNEKGVEDVLTDLQDFARRKPVVFLGGAFMLGIMAGRFVRSSGERYNQYEGDQYMTGYTGYSEPGGYSSSNTYTTSVPRTPTTRQQSGLDQASTSSQGQ
ncbi:MAG: hypothetical protein KC410_02235 [Anaerolineales bacterium]|uniref:hypothetical protein n=1 Tax=Promineifilum sp. TaxID=2664178 RepID=UPI001D9FFBBC|nr:hypothetical protein [Anaerolineales bacterium]MCB8936454.1 hypothetical protein [Promineifilum sp.]MCO5178585.1 hypothetical protein [Promineifilum sp.]